MEIGFSNETKVGVKKMTTNKMTTDDYELAELVIKQHKAGHYDDDDEEEQTYTCNECGTNGWGDERGEINDDGDFTCEECIEKVEDDDEPYQVIRECCKHGLTDEVRKMTKQEELREIVRLMELERQAFLQEQSKKA